MNTEEMHKLLMTCMIVYTHHYEKDGKFKFYYIYKSKVHVIETGKVKHQGFTSEKSKKYIVQQI